MFSENKRTIVSTVLLLLLVVVLVACAGPAQSGEPAANTAVSGQGGITVVGKGTAYGQPDQATVQVGVETFAETVEEATSQNEAKIQAIMEALAAQGVEEKDIQTSDYSLWAEQRHDENGPGEIVGYRVANRLSVTIRDINAVGEVLEAVTAAGANAIHGVQFSVSDPAALEDEARAAAVEDARNRAASLAELGNVELGNVQVISEVIGQRSAPFGMGDERVMEEMAAAPSISPGQLSYQVQIQVTFAIK